MIRPGKKLGGSGQKPFDLTCTSVDFCYFLKNVKQILGYLFQRKRDFRAPDPNPFSSLFWHYSTHILKNLYSSCKTKLAPVGPVTIFEFLEEYWKEDLVLLEHINDFYGLYKHKTYQKQILRRGQRGMYLGWHYHRTTTVVPSHRIWFGRQSTIFRNFASWQILSCEFSLSLQ